MNHPFQLFSIHHMCEYFKAWHQGQAAESCPCPTEHANSELAVCFYSLCHPRRCLVLARRGSISDWALWDEKTSCLADWLCCWKWKSHRCFASLKGWWSQCHILGLSNLTTRPPCPSGGCGTEISHWRRPVGIAWWTQAAYFGGVYQLITK